MSKYRNDFARCIAENIERGDKSYAHSIECWERHIEFTVKEALAAGFRIGVNDGEETVLDSCRNLQKIMKALFSTDEDYLFFYRKGEWDHFGWIHLVYGNNPDEVISNYSTNLGPIFMDKVNEFADNLF